MVLQTSTSEGETSVDELPFGCDLCEERFATREQLTDHVWESHEMDGDITTP